MSPTTYDVTNSALDDVTKSHSTSAFRTVFRHSAALTESFVQFLTSMACRDYQELVRMVESAGGPEVPPSPVSEGDKEDKDEMARHFQEAIYEAGRVEARALLQFLRRFDRAIEAREPLEDLMEELNQIDTQHRERVEAIQKLMLWYNCGK